MIVIDPLIVAAIGIGGFGLGLAVAAKLLGWKS